MRRNEMNIEEKIKELEEQVADHSNPKKNRIDIALIYYKKLYTYPQILLNRFFKRMIEKS